MTVIVVAILVIVWTCTPIADTPSTSEQIEGSYQRIRIHGSLCYFSPEAFEATERVGQDRSGCS